MTQSNSTPDIDIAISLGDGSDLYLTRDGMLGIFNRRTGSDVPLGYATKERLTTLQNYLERLKIHCMT